MTSTTTDKTKFFDGLESVHVLVTQGYSEEALLKYLRSNESGGVRDCIVRDVSKPEPPDLREDRRVKNGMHHWVVYNWDTNTTYLYDVMSDTIVSEIKKSVTDVLFTQTQLRGKPLNYFVKYEEFPRKVAPTSSRLMNCMQVEMWQTNPVRNDVKMKGTDVLYAVMKVPDDDVVHGLFLCHALQGDLVVRGTSNVLNLMSNTLHPGNDPMTELYNFINQTYLRSSPYLYEFV